MQETIDKHKNIFDAYLMLQTETYELLTRNIDMSGSLSKAYELFKRTPEMSHEAMRGRLKGPFEEIYGSLSSMFLRRIRGVATPYSEFLEVPSKAFAPRFGSESYMDLSRMWAEAPSNFLKGITNAYESYFEELQIKGKGEKDAATQMKELTPTHLLRNMLDEGTGVYYETISSFIEYYGESQFMFPKTVFVSLRNLISSHSKMRGLSRRYESLFHDGWEKSLGEFISAINNGKSPEEMEYEEFYGTFVDTFSEEYNRLLKSDEFIEAQNDVINTVSDVFCNFRQMTEAQLDMFPGLPFATRSEIDTIEKRIYDHSRRERELGKEVRRMKVQLKTTPASEKLDKLASTTREELAQLREKVEGMEKKIQRLSKKKG